MANAVTTFDFAAFVDAVEDAFEARFAEAALVASFDVGRDEHYPTPAILLVHGDAEPLEEDDDIGTGQQCLRLSCSAMVVVDESDAQGETRTAAVMVRSLALEVAAFVRAQMWGLHVDPARVSSVTDESWDPEDPLRHVYRVDWTHDIYVGDNEYDGEQDGDTPSVVWAGLAPTGDDPLSYDEAWADEPQPPPSRPWTPLDLGDDLIAWFDPDDLSTLTLDVQRVWNWRGKCPGFAGVCIASTGDATRRPTHAPGIGGAPSAIRWLELTPEGQRPALGLSPPLSPDGQVHYAGRTNLPTQINYTSTINRNNVTLSGSAVGMGYATRQSGDVVLVRTLDLTGGPSASVTSPGWQDWHVYQCVSTPTQHAPGVDGVFAAPVTGASVQPTFGIGSIGESSRLDFGDIVFTRHLTTADRQRVEGFLAWRYGAAAKLPIDHPYRNEPPVVTGGQG